MNTNRWLKGKTIVSGLLGAALALAAQVASAGTITGSAHDFSASAWSGGQICIACHAPHNTDTTVSGAPLWNHAVSAATYTLYGTPTFDGSVSITQPGGVSKLCLSCHDGTVAVNSFGGVTGTTFISGSKLLGTNLANDHPIGFTYDAALVMADGSLNATSTAVTIGSGTKTKATTIGGLLFSGKLECATCHDVHNTFTAPVGKLNRVTMTGSALCLTCHAK